MRPSWDQADEIVIRSKEPCPVPPRIYPRGGNPGKQIHSTHASRLFTVE
jgi:hypothetical protein